MQVQQLQYQAKHSAESLVSHYTGGGYLENHPDWHTADAPWKAAHVLQMLKTHKINPRSVLEIGCGAGEILNVLVQSMPDTRFTGLEISPQAFEMAKSKSNERLEFRQGDMEKLSPGEKFDLTLIIDVFEHVEDYFGFLRKTRQASDMHIFHIPLDLSAQMMIRSKPLLRKRKNAGHIHYFTRETALATLADTGYEVIDSFFTASYSDMPARNMASGVLNLFRKILFRINKNLTVRMLGGYSLMVLAKPLR